MTAFAPLRRNTRKLEDGFARMGFQCTHSAHESDIASVYSTASENPSGRYRPQGDGQGPPKRSLKPMEAALQIAAIGRRHFIGSALGWLGPNRLTNAVMGRLVAKHPHAPVSALRGGAPSCRLVPAGLCRMAESP
jgi:hypothetical protein